jgi:serine protease AprX
MALNRACLIFFCSVFLTVNLFSQTAPLTYLVSFTNKTGSPFSVSNPSAYLSQRAIDRRVRHNIPVDVTDIPVNSWYIDSLNNIAGVNVVARSKWFNNATVILSDTNALTAIAALPFVSGIKSSVTNVKWTVDPKAKSLVEQGRGNIYFTKDSIDYAAGKNQVEMLNGQFLHQLGYDGTDMQIAVMDLGFIDMDNLPQYEHLRSEGKLIQGPDFVHRDGNVYNSGTHGTLVMSCMGPNVSGEYIGTAPNATYYLLVTENDTSEFPVEEDYWIAAAEWADSAGADVFNTSLGYTQFDDSTMDHTYADLDGNTTRITNGVDMAAKKGILSVNSAGNSGTNPWYYISAPADADSNLTVGAVGPDRVYASFSSKGPSFDGRVKPNVATQGYLGNLIWPGNVIATGNGTSFSSPTLAGMVACLWSAFPEKTNMEIKHAIEYSASQYNSPDDFVGHGVPDMAKAYHYLKNTFNASGLNVMVLNNPFMDNFGLMLYSVSDMDLTLKLYDLGGKKIVQQSVKLKAKEAQEQRLDLHDKLLRSGVYVLKIMTPQGNMTLKVVKE